MRDAFQSYYPPSEKFFETLWTNSLIVLDTNVLLDMYRYSESTRGDFMSLFDKISNRLWIPHQVGLEFSRNRPNVIAEQVEMLKKAASLLDTLRESTAKEIEKILSFRLHPVLNKNEFKKAFEDPLAEMEKKIDSYTESYPDLLKADPILDALLSLLEGRVGPKFDDDRLEEIYKEGKKRYDRNLPPGYGDARGPNKKEGNAVYGDLILWLQILEHVKSAKISGVIFVCNDMKEDWWWQAKGKNLGCRPELRAELLETTGGIFHMYTSERFLQYASERINIKVKEESIDEVRLLEIKNRKASKNEAEHFTKSLLDKIYEEGLKRNEMISSIYPSAYSDLLEAERRRQLDYNQFIKPDLRPSGTIIELAEQIRKQAEIRQMLVRSLGVEITNDAMGASSPTFSSLMPLSDHAAENTLAGREAERVDDEHTK